MFEQSLILDSRHGAKAGALTFSLTTQTAVAGVLLLIPLIYTERLPLAQFTLPTILHLPPPPPPLPQQTIAARPRRPARTFLGFYVPSRIPPLNTTPEIVNEAPFTGLIMPDSGPPISVGTIPITNVGPPPPEAKPVPSDPPEKPVPVSGTLQAAKLIHKVVPAYPALAIMTRVSGTVHLLGIVGKDGSIEHLQVTSGHPLLVRAAVDAVKQWVYSPTILNGKPVEVSAPIDVIFTLSQ